MKKSDCDSDDLQIITYLMVPTPMQKPDCDSNDLEGPNKNVHIHRYQCYYNQGKPNYD